MNRKRSTLRQLAARIEELCGERGPGDGLDPRLDPQLHRCTSRRHKDLRKTLQLCRQVAVTIEVWLAASHSELLRSLQLLRVEPATNASHLRVFVSFGDSAKVATEAEVLATLAAASSAIRAEVAHDVHRRRAPELTFRFLPYTPDSDDPPPQAPTPEVPNGGRR